MESEDPGGLSIVYLLSVGAEREVGFSYVARRHSAVPRWHHRALSLA